MSRNPPNKQIIRPGRAQSRERKSHAQKPRTTFTKPDKFHTNENRNRAKTRATNGQSKRKLSVGRKDPPGRKNNRSNANIRSNNNPSPNGNEAWQYQRGGGGSRLGRGSRMHPTPNAPPPLPMNLAQLSDQKRREKEDIDFMKNTLKEENDESANNEYFDFQEKVEYLLDLQEDIMNLHLSAIREDAQMLKKESEIISRARSSDAEYEIDHYIRDTENLVRNKLVLYKQIADKIKLAKKALAEEEEISRRLKGLNF